jgi:hypothetical protein
MNILDEIKEKVSMLQVLDMYGQYPVRGRNNYRCFAHDDRRPSAGLTKTGDKFHCFSCGWTGNIFDVVMHFEKCDLKKAMRILDDKFRLGLYGALSHKEKLQIAREMRQREKEKQEKLWWEWFEKIILADVVKELRVYEKCERTLRIQKGEYRDAWSDTFGDVYFYAEKRVKWLDWLYAKLCGFDHPECEYDYIYPADKKELLEMIKSGAVSI